MRSGCWADFVPRPGSLNWTYELKVFCRPASGGSRTQVSNKNCGSHGKTLESHLDPGGEIFQQKKQKKKPCFNLKQEVRSAGFSIDSVKRSLMKRLARCRLFIRPVQHIWVSFWPNKTMLCITVKCMENIRSACPHACVWMSVCLKKENESVCVCVGVCVQEQRICLSLKWLNTRARSLWRGG